ncbi:hypothetical protein [Bacillus sp. 165]|uniref:hypothetical protein n=1 Tax=Bacillus sp. 165 TaxID=1529117 RepID=UPI001ADC312D|nr:hypothetical protein [Bacillus sp. 165]MBO9128522.1 hypothetical protein [Bacillus sp. 165]
MHLHDSLGEKGDAFICVEYLFLEEMDIRENMMFKSKKTILGFIAIVIVIFYSFVYKPSVPVASIQVSKKKYELQAKDYDYNFLGKSVTKNPYTWNNLSELNEYLQNEPELTVQTNQPITYKSDSSKDYTQVSIYSIEQNQTHGETETTVQTIDKPGHYIIQYSTEFGVGKIANYFVRVNVVNKD